MRWVSLDSLKPNSRLAQSIMDERGRILLSDGIELTSGMIARLKRIGIGSVCVDDPLTEDITPVEVVSSEVRSQLLELTYYTLHDLGSAHFAKLVKPPRVRERFQPLVEEVLDQLRRADGAGQQLGTVYLSDGELYHHSINVTFFSLCLGVHLGLPDQDLIELGIGTLLHDVGKLRVPEWILWKPSELTSEEFDLIKLHTNYGYEILSKLDDVSERSARIALEHHERYDGSGYPMGLRRDEIHFFSRITGVADVYEALTANRVYRKGYLPHQAFELLLGSSGTQFDPKVIDAFVSTIAVYPVGMTVVLSSGERAVVVRSPKKHSQRPVVRIVQEANGQLPKTRREIDLAKELTVQIVACEV